MTPRDELAELIEQAKEHLLYYRELGLSQIGEQARPDEIQLGPLKEVEPSSVRLESEKHAQESYQGPRNSQPVIENQNFMSNKKETTDLQPPSLFGELGFQAAEAQDRNETLEDIRAEMGDCRRCKLWSTRTKLVFGEGNPQAELMFIGEAPGADEDATGRPFVGRAGQLLTKMIEAIDLNREDVYIANVLKSRPPGNRNPEKDEVAACIPFLFRQIASIKPKLIVTLGNPAMQALLETKIGITRMRGEFQDYPRLAGVKVLPTFHPAYLLRSPDKKREAWDDLKKVRAFLRGEIKA